MTSYALVFFSITAIGGLILASQVLMGKLASWPLSIVHALLGATGLVLLGVGVMNGAAAGILTAALGLLVVAALGGFYLASIHYKGRIAPKGVVIIHAGVAVAGFLCLLSFVLGMAS